MDSAGARDFSPPAEFCFLGWYLVSQLTRSKGKTREGFTRRDHCSWLKQQIPHAPLRGGSE
jgi:hypothetical protein